MADWKQLDILKTGVSEWNRWREQSPRLRPDLFAAQLSGADLREANFQGADLCAADFRNANLNKANLSGAILATASERAIPLVKQDLDWDSLWESERGSDGVITKRLKSTVTNEDILVPDIFWEDLSVIEALRPEDFLHAEFLWANLSGAHLVEADLSEARLPEAHLEGADLGGANLNRADLRQAVLSGANLRGANLVGADLTDAMLEGADFRGADVRYANFSRTDLAGAHLGDARAGMTLFNLVDLSTANGVDRIKHEGPSTIAIDTIYSSRGLIPEVFLRGAGVSENLITYIGSLAGKPLEFYSCFISHSTRDQEFAEKLYADLQARGVRCWLAAHHMEPGKKIHEQIDQAIRIYERVLIILSRASIESEWVKTEIAKARKRELRENRRVLFPVRLVDFDVLREWECFDADTGKDSAREIREYFILDFSRWKDLDSYQDAFERLLQALKATTA